MYSGAIADEARSLGIDILKSERGRAGVAVERRLVVEILFVLLEFDDKVSDGRDNGATLTDKVKSSTKGDSFVAHEIGNDDAGRAGDTGNAVDKDTTWRGRSADVLNDVQGRVHHVRNGLPRQDVWILLLCVCVCVCDFE